MTTVPNDQWRRIVAALANDRAREVFARLTVGETADAALEGLSPSRRRHVIETLRGAGLVTGDGDDLRADGGVFARVLAATPATPRPTGPDRFLSPDGRLRGYPAQARERRALLELVAGRILHPGEVLDERAINERLATVVDDVAVLRRYLVDHELVERTRSGAEYVLVTDAPTT
ncbi:DUF2087 domain-containing protein [Microbacterium sp. NPDC077663]|uniref:DUF2087 domain-containing protein n=1 Tax=Microbacterium sp. NPDC077663 TaxID=3364189 RepID=UPI0037C73CCC